jgi:hypothetical protein
VSSRIQDDHYFSHNSNKIRNAAAFELAIGVLILLEQR